MAENSKDSFLTGLSSESPGVGDYGPGAFDWVKGFAKSGLESVPELIGITPSTETAHWRQDNPVAGFLSEMAGTAVPYMGWFKATKLAGRFDKAVTAIANSERPFLTGAAQEAARFAPFEAGRLAVSQVAGDKSFGEMLGDTSLNLALGSGIGGALHGFAAAGKRDAGLKTIFPDLDIAAPLPLQARQMRQIIDSGVLQGEQLDRANAKLLDTIRSARGEELPQGYQYVAPIDYGVPEANNDALQKQLNRLFRPKTDAEEGIIQVKKFAHGQERDFPSPAAWAKAAEEAGLPPGFEDKGQFFRDISFKIDQATPITSGESARKRAQTIDNTLTKNMESVGDNTFLTREADDGLFVVAKKTRGEVGTGTADDRWLLFKTDQPGTFLPDADRWSQTMVAKQKWNPTAVLAEDGGDIYNAVKNYKNEFPINDYTALSQGRKGFGGLIDRLLPQGIKGADSEIVSRLGEAIREYVAPRIHQFKKSFRANYIVNATKSTYDVAENMVNGLVNGELKADPGKALYYRGLQNDKEGVLGFQPVRDLVDAIPEKDFQEQFYNKIWRANLDPDKIPALQAAGEISPEVGKLATELSKIQEYVMSNTHKAENAVGHPLTEWRASNYGLPRVWEGDTRILIQNDAGELAAVASGPTRRVARAQAESILKEHPDWKLPEHSEFSISQGVPGSVANTILKPSWLLEKENLRGFKYDTKPFTKDEFMKGYENALRNRTKYQAGISIDDVMGPELAKLAHEDPAAYRMVRARMDDYAGKQSAFAQYQNRMTDKILAPVIGTDSASKIVQLTNTTLYNFQLGGLKLSYPIINSLQFLQTVVPEYAFVVGRAVPEDLAGTYSHFAMGGSKGPVGAVAAISPLKMMYKSMTEMARPSAELSEAFRRAANDRVIDPKLVEEYVGSSAVKAKDLQGVLKGEKSFVEWLRAVSEWMPAQTERLSRTHSFTVGYITARDFLHVNGEKLNPNQIYAFAKQFTENTMYTYSAADRSRIFTTPAGSAFGLFKNWMVHYIASMGEYTRQGFTQNNWAPLLWQTSGTFALGGLAATPMWWGADAFSKMWGDGKKGLMEQSYAAFGPTYGDAILLGLPAAITGISLYSAVNSPVSNPTRDAASLFSIVAWDRVKQFGKLGAGAFDNWQATGEHPATNQGVRELMARAFMPTTIYRSLAAFTEPDKIIQAGTGYPVIKNVSAVDKVLYSFGFNPVEVDRAQAVAADLYSSHEKMAKQVKQLGLAWAEAETNKDSGQMGLIMRQSILWGVDVSKVLEEGMKGVMKRQKDVMERAIRPADMAKVRALMAVQKGEEP